VVLASLGGLPAISALIAGLPRDFPVPLLVLQHRPRCADPHRLTWLLGKQTQLPVRTAATGMPAATAGITVIPGGHHATITPAGTFRLAESGRGGGDTLLASAVQAAAPRGVIAVVLSGMLQDGADGVRAVKRHGGRVIVQDPATARAPGMPASAIATGCADFVLPADRIPYALITLAMAPGGAELFSVPLPHWAKVGA
jgi:two-component system chemotaxis response regulator CheB